MVMAVVQALCEFSVLVSQQNHSDLSLTALEEALKQFYKKTGAFQKQKLLKTMKAIEDTQLGRQSCELWEHKIHEIGAAMEVQVYRAEKVTRTKQMQFEVHLNRA